MADKPARIASLVVTLADGPHRLSVPGWPQLEYVQDRGYPAGVFARSSERMEDVIAEVVRQARVAAGMAIPDETRGVTWTPEQVVEAIDALAPTFGAVIDYGAIRAHLTALLIAAEPNEHWTDDRVASVMVPSDVYRYAEALKTLYSAAFARSEEPGES